MAIYQLQAGVTQTLAVTGRYFRVLSALGDLRVRIRSQGGEMYEGTLQTGLGINFTDRSVFPMPFSEIQITSEQAQQVNLWHELAEVSDDRLSGNFDVNAALNVASTAPSAHNVSLQTISGATEVLPLRTTRKQALIQVSGDVYVQSTNGVKLNGLFTWENQSALTLIPVSGSVDVRINEDFD